VEIGACNVVGEDAVILWEVLCAAVAFPSGRGHAIAGFGFVIIGGDKGGGGIKNKSIMFYGESIIDLLFVICYYYI
jgi:hypothetical protein